MGDPSAIVRLRSAREELPAALREEILALGDAAVAPLLAVLVDDDEALGDGWAPIHAVDLLADFKAERAITPMLDVLVESDWDHIIHDRLLQRLPSFGASVVEPTLALVVEYDDEEDVLHSLATVVMRRS